MKTKNVIFDYGSVLVGWNPQILMERIIPSEPERSVFEEILNRDYIPTVDISYDLASFVEQFSADYPYWERAAKLYRKDWTDMLGPEIEGMEQVIEGLRQQGCGVYGLTNWNRETFNRSREIRPIMQMIPEENLVVSGDINLGKPDPAIFRYALNKFGLRAGDCVFVDDRASNVAGAIRCGLKGIVFKNAEDLKKNLARFDIIL